MAEKLEDLNLPNAVVTRIVKEALPDGVNVAKEARIALAKSASVFILYITSSANNAAASNNRKTINGPDVLQALANAEFYSFVEPLQDVLEDFRKMKKEKKEAYAKRKQQKEKKIEQERNAQEMSSDIDKENSMEEDKLTLLHGEKRIRRGTVERQKYGEPVQDKATAQKWKACKTYTMAAANER